jgi:Glycosyl hydrolase catalytic core
MRIHGSGGFQGGGPQANWKQGDQQNTPSPAAPVQGSGSGWGNWKDKGQGGDQFQSSFDMSKQGNNGTPGPGNWQGGHGFGGWHYGQGGSPFKVDDTQSSTPAPTPTPAAPAPTPASPAPSPTDSSTDSSTSTPSPIPSTGSSDSSTSSGFSGGKEGLGVSDTSSNGDGSNLGSTKASWYYNWSPNASSKVNDPNATFVPMIWGQGNMNATDLAAAKNSSSPMLLTFNEPELASQGNM